MSVALVRCSTAEFAAQELAETVGRALLEGARRRAPRTWLQAPRVTALGLASDSLGETARLITTRRLRGVSELAVSGWCRLWAGAPVELERLLPNPARVLRLQARGARVVTLLPATATPPAPHPDSLAFLLHDLCHLAKFGAPAHYAEQVGFFSTLQHALGTRLWREHETELDAEWARDRDQVAADMNGASVFLFAVLKMKLKMAARRSLALREQRPAPTHGALDPRESQRFSELLSGLLAALNFGAELSAAAVATSARRDCPRAAARLTWHFREVGERVLRGP